MQNVTSGGATRYQHWDIRGGDWILPQSTLTASVAAAAAGEGDSSGSSSSSMGVKAYMRVTTDHIVGTLQVIDTIVERYKDNPVVMGLEPGNMRVYAVFVYELILLVLFACWGALY